MWRRGSSSSAGRWASRQSRRSPRQSTSAAGPGPHWQRCSARCAGVSPGLATARLAVAAAALMFVCHGLALRGWVRGDAFIASAIGAAVALVGLFTLYPLSRLLVRAFVDSDGHASLKALTARIASSQIWGYGGVVWNTLQLGVMTATAATLLALGFALVVTRTRLPGRRLVGVMAIVPMITPPFVIGLALIMLFGRSGVVNAMLEYGVRRRSDALDLRSARRLARANARAHAGCVSRARRCRRRDQPGVRRGCANAARIALSDVRNGHAAADGAWA